tara:strand:+ start:11084 stop:11791 length:708 start_codon:yes stop_codon:yes gene_type:complete
MDVYLTDTIVIKDEKIYYNDKLIKRHNWHLKLAELGWSKLHRNWITKLNKLYNTYPNNSLFGALECGDDGDCLFHCVATALNSQHNDYYESKDIRKKIADSITQEQFDDIITCYRCMKDIDDFNEDWNPYDIDTLEKFKQQVMVSGNEYWGDYLIIQLLNNVYQLNIFILTQNEIEDIYEPYPLALRYNPLHKTIVLLHVNNSHFKLVGKFKDIMDMYFTHESLPIEIKKLFKLK